MKPATQPAAKRAFKESVYAALALIPSALANRHRLELLDLLTQRPRTVQDLATETGLSVAKASQHLQVLAKCGLATVERRGTFAAYRAAGGAVYRLIGAVREVAARERRAAHGGGRAASHAARGRETTS